MSWEFDVFFDGEHTMTVPYVPGLYTTFELPKPATELVAVCRPAGMLRLMPDDAAHHNAYYTVIDFDASPYAAGLEVEIEFFPDGNVPSRQPQKG